jgi:hypothetical protein
MIAEKLSRESKLNSDMILYILSRKGIELPWSISLFFFFTFKNMSKLFGLKDNLLEGLINFLGLLSWKVFFLFWNSTFCPEIISF